VCRAGAHRVAHPPVTARAAGDDRGAVGGPFVACVLLTARNPSWAFYLLPTRARELGVGAMLALLPAARLPGWSRLAMVVVGPGWSGCPRCCWHPVRRSRCAGAVARGRRRSSSRRRGRHADAASRLLGSAVPRYRDASRTRPTVALADAGAHRCGRGPLTLPMPWPSSRHRSARGAHPALVERLFREGRWIGRRPGRNLVQAAALTLVVAGLGLGVSVVAQDRVASVFAGLTPKPVDFDRGLHGWCFTGPVRDRSSARGAATGRSWSMGTPTPIVGRRHSTPGACARHALVMPLARHAPRSWSTSCAPAGCRTRLRAVAGGGLGARSPRRLPATVVSGARRAGRRPSHD
jgi:hypothetical protein